MDILSLLAGLFLIAYGFGVIGWPYDFTRGVAMLERRSRRTRTIIGGVIIVAGLFLVVVSFFTKAA
jgi:uncharacterized protein YjeT (DUF2065 family)